MVCNSATNKCEVCGSEGDWCCAGSEPCGQGVQGGQGLMCNSTTEKCETCGSEWTSCCPGDLCGPDVTDGQGMVCNSATNECEVCGFKETLCCSNKTCGLLLTCNSITNTRSCGKFGEPCCGGKTCDSPLECSGNQCQHCGGIAGATEMPCCNGKCNDGFICMYDGSIDAQGTCKPCGGPDQRCCALSLCGVGLTCFEEDPDVYNCGGLACSVYCIDDTHVVSKV
jgi:hypothetical protein